MSTNTYQPRHTNGQRRYLPVAASEHFTWRFVVVLMAVLAVLIVGVSVANASTTQGKPPVKLTCWSKLQTIQNVSRQAGIVVGSIHTGTDNHGTPDTWARELKDAQLYELADLARAINSAVTDRDFVVAFTNRASYLVADCGRGR